METFNLIKKSVVIAFASIIVACGAETLIAIVFIPAFAAQWPVVGDSDYFIDLRPDDSKKVKSDNFTGTELHNTDNAKNDNPIVGSFNGLNIEFTIKRPSGNVKYKGKMTPVSDENHQIIKIEVNSNEGKLILGSE